MPFEIVRNDITNMQVDAVVNTANPNPVIGSGVDAGMHKKAGPLLLDARQKIGCINLGEAAITPGFDMDAKYIIHTVAPIWEDGNHLEAQICHPAIGNHWYWQWSIIKECHKRLPEPLDKVLVAFEEYLSVNKR